MLDGNQSSQWRGMIQRSRPRQIWKRNICLLSLRLPEGYFPTSISHLSSTHMCSLSPDTQLLLHYMASGIGAAQSSSAAAKAHVHLMIFIILIILIICDLSLDKKENLPFLSECQYGKAYTGRPRW